MSGRSNVFLGKQHPVFSRSNCANTTISFETTECVLEQDTLFALHCTGQTQEKRWLNSNMNSKIIEPKHEISNNAEFATSKISNQPAHKHTRNLTRTFASRLNIIWLLCYWPTSIGVSMLEKKAAPAGRSLFMSKCHVVGTHYYACEIRPFRRIV